MCGLPAIVYVLVSEGLFEDAHARNIEQWNSGNAKVIKGQSVKVSNPMDDLIITQHIPCDVGLSPLKGFPVRTRAKMAAT